MEGCSRRSQQRQWVGERARGNDAGEYERESECSDEETTAAVAQTTRVGHFAHGRGLDGVVCDVIGEGGLRGVGGTSSGKQERTVRRLHSHLREENHALNVVVL